MGSRNNLILQSMRIPRRMMAILDTINRNNRASPAQGPFSRVKVIPCVGWRGVAMNKPGATKTTDEYGNEYPVIHTHLCPECFFDEPCEMDCSQAGESEDDGSWHGSPTACERCRNAEHLRNMQGGGI